ncbi:MULTISPECIES: arylamine N-acetyltransferase [unclassified Azospirillum]|uniref:arylamine N-acetyltransferase family protein n=1 Tax=unclassified Azospirillum TaxID=2630922 RepID=UPI000B6BD7EB|nr:MULTISPECIES: arylamine N-acetyltransferase [unclassified Azospirillum]SNS64868.1 N-hydroxyarylamine O-acetyltransferase [Azospirillum sp. RU38E]SNS83763.1 N-hydroxyarylamine O-acetyltransferase [Azospirillum sp. RU37A]
MFDLSAYLARIRLDGPVLPDLAGLHAIHTGHTANIPFENLDIQMGLPIRLEPDAITAKLVGQRRGGYCFEQNSLLALALAAIGFAPRRRLARVRMGGEPGGRSHLLLLVAVEGQDYITDVGFGGSCLAEPLPLRVGEYDSGGELWRLRPSDWSPGWELELRRDGEWSGLYWFGDEAVVDADLAFGNHFTATHPGSRFVQNRVASRTTLRERHTLLNGQYRRRLDGVLVEERQISDEREFRALLAERFFIELPDDALLRPVEGIRA